MIFFNNFHISTSLSSRSKNTLWICEITKFSTFWNSEYVLNGIVSPQPQYLTYVFFTPGVIHPHKKRRLSENEKLTVLSPSCIGELITNQRIMTIPTIYKGYILRLDVKPIGPMSGWRTILHFTATGETDYTPGSRIPAIWVRPETVNLAVSNQLNENGNHVVSRVSHGSYYRWPSRWWINLFTGTNQTDFWCRWVFLLVVAR